MPDSPAPATVLSAKPVILPVPGRGEDLQVRVSAPMTGRDLPVIVFSHGFGMSMDGYAPLADHWAAQGFVVLQPTHLDSRTLGLPPEDPRTPHIWRIRIEDLKHVMDGLDTLEAALPGLSGRLDRDRIAVAGHSWGAQSASTLLGARILDADGMPGEDLSEFAAEHFPFMKPYFGDMATPALIVAGDHDQSALSTRGPDWFTDPYVHSSGSKSLLTLFGGEHSLGGVSGYEAAETTDEDPARVALIQRLTTAFLRSALHPEDTGWKAALEEDLGPQGKLESK
jgi:predicted alpha/beta-hydrolase family hydrolase